MLQYLAFVFTCIAMTITSGCVVAALYFWLDEVILARRKYCALREDIQEASGKLDEIFGEREIPSELVSQILRDLRGRYFINWAQVRIDYGDTK